MVADILSGDCIHGEMFFHSRTSLKLYRRTKIMYNERFDKSFSILNLFFISLFNLFHVFTSVDFHLFVFFSFFYLFLPSFIFLIDIKLYFIL